MRLFDLSARRDPDLNPPATTDPEPAGRVPDGGSGWQDPARYAALSVAVGLVILVCKFVAWQMTGSVALLSDALESIINVLAASVALVLLRVANKPPDPNHPFGHGKAEYFSAGVEGALVILAGMLIVVEGVRRLIEPLPLEQTGLALVISGAASLANAGLALTLVRAGTRLRSPALKADGIHIYADVLTSFGVIAGIGLASLTDFWILDPLVAVVVGLNVLRVGWHASTDAVQGLMDHALPDEEFEAIAGQIAQAAPEALEVHALRARRAGRQLFLECHLVLDGDLPVRRAHVICDRIEAVLEKHYPGVFCAIHVEPESEIERGNPDGANDVE